MISLDYEQSVMDELQQVSDPEKRQYLPKFFRAFPGGYGEGDKFLGVTVPNQRKVAKRFAGSIPLEAVEQLLTNEYHECRLTALFILVAKYQKAAQVWEKEKVVQVYLNRLDKVNNWDLVDSSAEKILGPHLFTKDKNLLYSLATSDNLWYQRIAIMTTFYFIKQGDYRHTFRLAELLLDHPHDLIHKAVGWMLREIGKRDFQQEYTFLKEYYHRMPRTMLRYAIEKFEPTLRKQFLSGDI